MNLGQMPTIGIAGVGIPSTLYCIEKINYFCRPHFPDLTRPNMVMHTPNLAPTYIAESSNQWDKVTEYLLASINLLAQAGADFAIIPANAVHKVITQVQKRAPIPVLDLLAEVSDWCQAQGYKKVGIAGTSWTVQGHYYQSRLALHDIIEVILPDEKQLLFHHAIMNELVPTATLSEAELLKLLHAIEFFKQQNCDALVLACTELPLVLNDHNCGLPTVDTTAILAQAAVREVLKLLPK